jgi:1-acyl-sn-glycerol-3-phosphate acyltransferase
MTKRSRFAPSDRGARGPAASLAFKTAELTLRALRHYHRHQAVGLEHVPRDSGALIVCNHSFATYDGWLLGIPILDELGRLPHAIGDHLMMRSRLLGPFFRELGFIEGSRDAAIGLLRSGELLGVVPGGMREALRSSKDKYRIDWAGRTGFVRASMMSGAPILLAACPRADDIFEVADLALTRTIYRRFRVPVALLRGVGPTLIPRPVKLTHLISEPIHSPVAPDRVTDADVEAHHAALAARMQRLMHEALELPA